MSFHEETFTRGATFKSAHKSTRDLAVRLLEENPTASRGRLLNLYAAAVQNDQEYLDACLEAQGTNDLNWAEQHREREHARTLPKAQKAQQKGAKAAARTQKTAKASTKLLTRFLLLETKMPNGKAYRDCTREDLEQMGEEMAAMIATLKPGQRVGDVYKSNKELPC
jgi:hypothetical protein